VNLCTQVFINGTLAIDLGGAHGKLTATVQLNKTNAPTLYTPWNKNLTIGRTYGTAELRPMLRVALISARICPACNTSNDGPVDPATNVQIA
jgi:hypothetical protein